MAIYHFSAQVFSRSKGQSVVAAAAYRSGERLEDERTGEEKFYKRGVSPKTLILAPEHSPEWVNDRERLWNEVEKAETRKNSQLAREINVALPRELSNEDQEALIREFIQDQFVNRGMVADIAIHRDDQENPHAHVMLTTREISPEGFTVKNREWNDRELLNQWREEWANYVNQALENAGIQERISHLSHEARGLEQLPTVHLGHVAHEMEQRGITTDRGDINRERQDYNQVVIDLQKYREEKEALERQKAIKQTQTQQPNNWTPAERVQVQAASKYFKDKPNLTSIKERLQQLDKWEKRLNDNSQFLLWKNKAFREAGEHFRWIHTYKNNIHDEQQAIEKLNWLNPLNIKSNRTFKARSEQKIADLEKRIHFQEQKLAYHREKLGFSDEKEFQYLEKQFQMERPTLMAKNENQRQALNEERSALQGAQKAIQNRFVRELAYKYPNNPEMAYIRFETALDLHRLNQSENRTIPIAELRHTQAIRDQKVNALQDSVSRAINENVRLSRAEDYVKRYEKHNETVQKYESSPLLKGKLLVSKSSKKEYEAALNGRDQCSQRFTEHGVKDPKDFYAQKEASQSQMAEVPKFESQANFLKQSTSILDGILSGIQQAIRTEERNREYEKQKSMRKRRKQRYHEMEENEM
jgi:hypothetical protein